MNRKLISLFLVILMVASAFTAISLTATPVAAHTTTKTTLLVSKASPIIGEKVTFTAQLLKWTGTAWVAVPWESTPQLKIVHYANGVMVTDVAKKTDSYGKITWQKSWTSAGARTYYAYFGGDATYVRSTSASKTITVQKILTRTSITVSKASPAINEKVTFTAKLEKFIPLGFGMWGWSPLRWESTPQLKIVHYANGVMVTDVAKTTDGNGKITWTKSWTSAGARTYYAYFGGDAVYAKSVNTGKTVTPLATTSISLRAPPYALGRELYTLLGFLKDRSGHPLANKWVYIWRYSTKIATLKTDAYGKFSTTTSGGGMYHSSFPGDGSYLPSRSYTVGTIII